MTDSRVTIVAGVNPSTGSEIAVALAMKRVKVTVAARRVKEWEEAERPIKEAESGAIFVKTNVTNEKVIRSNVAKPAKTYGGVVYAFDNMG